MGIFLTLFGVLLTLDTVELVELSAALRFWPIGFHVLGLTILMRRADRHGRFWGILWLVVGTSLLLNSLGMARIGFWDLVWPLLIVLVGVRLIMRARGGGVASPIDAQEHRPNLVAVLSESKGSVTQTLTGASLTSVLGGCHLDLRQAAVAAGGSPVIDVFSILGGQEIVVPSGWTVVFDVVSILSGTEDKRLPTIGDGALRATTPQIIVRGIAIFSGLTVKN
jgi:predicted membrane protein